MNILNVLLILFIGTFAGFINVVAGGGSLLTLPMLIFLGLPSAVANGTNRVALTMQNIIAIWNFKRKGFFDYKLGITLSIPAVLGSIVGSRIAISIPDEVFNKILAVVMFIIIFTLIKKPKKKAEDVEEELTKKKKIILGITFFFMGIYGGLLQAGTGFIIITSLTLLSSLSLVSINSIKVIVTFFYVLSSLVVFIISGNVDWIFGLVLAVGNGIGGYLGSNFSINKGDVWIKRVLIVMVSVMAIKLLFGW
ncbi:hypothetical protein SAMN00017405_1819 [Desulfonispora thiosulfatigenes DSM 11270]|uniref:Probable membrane transporter protein n=1 Tax=Desulfonispora thiosulfatigenes DSM 11270 TaxID=656914 RepID=A0A1W1V3T2_DESTI|nr:sulfite exporter TauE/SafE family protein [Desulfonispora thiosulfatigenes]SMB88029.1 hypothetical protein SAMN00017405_1819 [Desulfonispora thiosulfatigenes DSM 11270]